MVMADSSKTSMWGRLMMSHLHAELRLQLSVPSSTIAVGLFHSCLHWVLIVDIAHTTQCHSRLRVSPQWLSGLRWLWRPQSCRFSFCCHSPSLWLKNLPWRHGGSWPMTLEWFLDAQTCPWTQFLYRSRLSSTPGTHGFWITVVLLLGCQPRLLSPVYPRLFSVNLSSD